MCVSGQSASEKLFDLRVKNNPMFVKPSNDCLCSIYKAQDIEFTLNVGVTNICIWQMLSSKETNGINIFYQ